VSRTRVPDREGDLEISEEAFAPIDAVLSEATLKREVPGVVAGVASTGDWVYQGSFGRASSRAPMADDTIFRIASLTKLVTSIAILMLAEERKLVVNGPVADCLPTYRQPELLEYFDYQTGTYSTRSVEDIVTVHQLLTHTSGYGYWWLDRPLMALSGGKPELFNPPFLMHAPGTKFSYSTSTDVLGQVVEAVAGVSLAEFFAARIFGPLGMADTGYALPADPDRLASVYARSSGALEERPRETTGAAPRGGGGLYSTVGDYLKLLRVLLNRGAVDDVRLLERSTVTAMTKNQIGELFAEPQNTAHLTRSNDFIFMDGTQKFGFGVMVESRDQATGRPQGSYGWGGLYNTYYWVDPHLEIAATIMMQVVPFADPGCVALYQRFERAVYDVLDA
jgi:methyl acetate hydrolase